MVESAPQRDASRDLVGPARFIRLGHRPDDGFVERQAKSIVAGVLIFIALAATVFLLDPGRSTFVHMVDVFSILSCAIVLWLLHSTGSLKLAFRVISVVSMILIVTFLLIVGNRGADLILPLVFPLLAVVTIGPQESRIWIVAFVATLILIYLVDPHLPEVSVGFMISPDNPTGSLFHAPTKNAVDGVSLVTAILGAGLTYGIVYFSWTQLVHSRNVVAQQRVELARAYEKSERLLHNILPDSVAERLKEDPGTTIADDLDDVAILIADIVDFTKTAAEMPASDVVALLNEVFSAFDRLVAERGLEKIKTSGDAYMVAAGLSDRSPVQLDLIADLALAMQDAAHEIRNRRGVDLSVRIGLHSGLATAGVVGTLKFYYDIWGDTVNLAARLQSAARPGTIRVSQEVFAKLKNGFAFNPSEETDLKGKGTVRSYELLGRKTV